MTEPRADPLGAPGADAAVPPGTLEVGGHAAGPAAPKADEPLFVVEDENGDVQILI